MTWLLRCVLLLSMCVCSSACHRPSGQQQTNTAPPPPSQPPAPDRAQYDLRGKVVSVEKYSERVTVSHEPIPGFMGAMTMPYTVKGGHALDQLAPGDEITAKVISSGGGYWLEDIVVTKRAAAAK